MPSVFVPGTSITEKFVPIHTVLHRLPSTCYLEAFIYDEFYHNYTPVVIPAARIQDKVSL